MVTSLYNTARAIKHKAKIFADFRADATLSAVRKIERVHPIRGKRVVAMTFDDGPCSLDFDSRGKALTACILDILKEYGARATFDIIGTTEYNYPDACGTQGTPYFSGVHYDHYPCFGEDSLGGAVNNRALIQRMIDEGHELANHSFTHRIAGSRQMIYGKRVPLESLDSVVSDLARLHTYMVQEFGYQMKLARPPHYVDRVTRGGSVYDAYSQMGYQYLAASFDGDGWRPQTTFAAEVSAMIDPLRSALKKDSNSLNGQIIFQKDGCNMNLRAPIVEALPIQLQLLQDYGYAIIPVSEILELSPTLDVMPSDPILPHIVDLISRKHAVCYRNNTFHPERRLTTQDVLLMLAAPYDLIGGSRVLSQVARRYGIGEVSGNGLLKAAEYTGVTVEERMLKDKSHVCRGDAISLISALVARRESDCEVLT